MNIFTAMLKKVLAENNVAISQERLLKVGEDLTREMVYFINAEVPVRLAYLLTMEFQHEQVDDKNTVFLGTQDDMAMQIGASRSFVSTIINEMKRDGLIEAVGRRMRLRDAKKLAGRGFDKNTLEIVQRYTKRMSANA